MILAEMRTPTTSATGKRSLNPQGDAAAALCSKKWQNLGRKKLRGRFSFGLQSTSKNSKLRVIRFLSMVKYATPKRRPIQHLPFHSPKGLKQHGCWRRRCTLPDMALHPAEKNQGPRYSDDLKDVGTTHSLEALKDFARMWVGKMTYSRSNLVFRYFGAWNPSIDSLVSHCAKKAALLGETAEYDNLIHTCLLMA